MYKPIAVGKQPISKQHSEISVKKNTCEEKKPHRMD
jgi:hypothetical protein